MHMEALSSWIQTGALSPTLKFDSYMEITPFPPTPLEVFGAPTSPVVDVESWQLRRRSFSAYNNNDINELFINYYNVNDKY